jgi:endonuclease YncB( thermonuclease family)
MSKAPPHGISIPVEILDVHDGDTVTVRRVGSNLQLKIRLLDNWAPEISIRGLAKQFSEAKQAKILKAGAKAKEALQALISNASKFTLFLPFATIREDNIFDMVTMGRVLGYVYADDTDVSEYLVQHGLSYTTKDGLVNADLG